MISCMPLKLCPYAQILADFLLQFGVLLADGHNGPFR